MKTSVFLNISTSFQRSWLQMVYWHISYDHEFGKEIDIFVQVLFLLSIIIFNLMRILTVLQITAGKTVIKESPKL